MEPVRIMCCDDECCVLNQLKECITQWSQERGVAVDITTLEGCGDLIRLYADGRRFDLMFLDIVFENKGDNGFSAAKQIKAMDENAMIALVSGKNRYVVEGYDVAVKYIEKPFECPVIREVLDKCHCGIGGAKALVLESGNCIARIPVSEIVYVESVGHAVEIHTDKNVIQLNAALCNIMDAISAANIVRCHRAFLVNLGKIRAIGKYDILLADGGKIPVSRRERPKVLKQFMMNRTDL